MLQTYASDALEDAMRLAQTKAYNSYTWSDMFNYLNYAWSDVYQRICMMDEGYYSETIRLTDQITTLPPHIKNVVKVYRAQYARAFYREIYREAGYSDLSSPRTFKISGNDVLCSDARSCTVWCNYVPPPKPVYFTMNNRDPKLYESYTRRIENNYNMYRLTQTVIEGKTKYVLVYRAPVADMDVDITDVLEHGQYWELSYISCDFPYIFCSWTHSITGERHSGFYKDIINSGEFIEYNPFAYLGRNSNVEYLDCRWNDKTGLGVVITDYNDGAKIKELGWTPDTLINYPAPEVYRYLVAVLADKFAALNESSSMGVSKELVEARFAFDNFLKKNKAAWARVDNVNPPTMGDWL